ncbi:MAG: hypothetical protein KJZ83_18450 [Burkholderiaceae bacterium]|nr:hypothetical protein [Burkholderiaceae bacterium]
MNERLLGVRATGLVTSVGLSAPTACAAMRAKLSNPTETRFIDHTGEWIMAHEVPLEQPWRGRRKLARMAAMAIDECLASVEPGARGGIALILCVAEQARPGRIEGLEDQLFLEIEAELGCRFADSSLVIAQGRVGLALALAQARKLVHEQGLAQVLIAATDSLLHWPTLSIYESASRLLTADNSNGFMPGEGAGAILVGKPSGAPELLCAGLGFGVERAHVESEEPLRAEGLSTAFRQALADAGCELHELDFRITDVSGEQYYFKEAALALSRTMRGRREAFDFWHPAENIGEAGATSGLAIVALADAACRKSYAPGRGILCHMGTDGGRRAAVVTVFSTELPQRP